MPARLTGRSASRDADAPTAKGSQTWWSVIDWPYRARERSYLKMRKSRERSALARHSDGVRRARCSLDPI
jgi:hypothetical protein